MPFSRNREVFIFGDVSLVSGCPRWGVSLYVYACNIRGQFFTIILSITIFDLLFFFYSYSESENSRLSLWKFLLELLLTNSYSSLIDWRRIHALEFHIKQPQDVAKLWSTYKSDSSIDCTRFKKALRYYCNKEQPILHHVMGKEDNVYQFSSSMLYYINNRYSQFQRSNLSPSTSSATLEQAQDMCGSQEVLVVD